MAEEEKKGGALTAFAGGGKVAVSKEARAAALMESAEAGGSGGGDTIYLTFSGQGANYAGWKIGRDKKKPDADAVYIVDPDSSTEGWTCWKGGSPVAKHEWSVFERKTMAVSQAQLEDHGPYADGDGWQFMMGISMFDVDEPGQKITFSTTSKSGRNALGDMTKEIAERIIADDPEVPVIQLTSEMFEAQGKKNGKPGFDIEGWVTPAEVFAFLEAGDDGDLEDLLAGGYEATSHAEEPEVEEEQEEAPAPKRRRRKASA